MNRVLSNQEYLWELVRSSKKEFRHFLTNINEEQLKTIIECVINCNIDKAVLETIKKLFQAKKINEVVSLLNKKQDIVKAAIAIVLTDLLSEIDDG